MKTLRNHKLVTAVFAKNLLIVPLITTFVLHVLILLSCYIVSTLISLCFYDHIELSSLSTNVLVPTQSEHIGKNEKKKHIPANVKNIFHFLAHLAQRAM